MRRTGLSKSSSSKFKHPASNLKLSDPVETENANPNCSPIGKPKFVQQENKRATESENEPITPKRSRDAFEDSINPSAPEITKSLPVAKKPALLHQNQKAPSQTPVKAEPAPARLEYWTCLHTKVPFHCSHHTHFSHAPVDYQEAPHLRRWRDGHQEQRL